MHLKKLVALALLHNTMELSRAETYSYLDDIDITTDVISTTGWFASRLGYKLVDGDFMTRVDMNANSVASEYVRIDLGREVKI